MEAGRIPSRKVSEKELKPLTIEEGQFQKEALFRQGFDRPVKIQTLEETPKLGGLDPSHRDVLTHDR